MTAWIKRPSGDAGGRNQGEDSDVAAHGRHPKHSEDTGTLTKVGKGDGL